MTAGFKGAPEAVDHEHMEATSSPRPVASKRGFALPPVPLAVWVTGATGWVLVLRRIVAELLG